MRAEKVSSSVLTRYFLFAILASGINIGVQWLTIRLCREEFHPAAYKIWIIFSGWLTITEERFYLLIAIAAGTASGLIFKYLLDKKFIFSYKSGSGKKEASTFFLYSFTGLLTTLIFWTVEWGFDYVIATEWAKYAGAAVGLAIGYISKFFLDRRFVFVSPNPAG